MKFPKNRANVYGVLRWDYSTDNTSLCGVFAHYEDAHDFADACKQEFIDKGFEFEISKAEIVFEVVLTTFYG